MPKSLSNSLKTAGVKKPEKREPLWAGPSGEGKHGGITFSLLSRFLTCRERFRLLVVDGLRPANGFSHFMEYGQMWHVCEEHFAAGEEWKVKLLEYAKGLCGDYPLAREQIDKWYNLCLRQFPIYVRYWEEHPDIVARTPLLQENVFDIRYTLPSGRVVRLRGKMDSVDLVDGEMGKGVWLQENKTKSQVDVVKLGRQLSFDLQTMMYVLALKSSVGLLPKKVPFHGVRYNVIRRPLSGGKGSIVRHKGTANKPEERLSDYYDRAAQYIEEEPHEYFTRFNTLVTDADINRFKDTCLDPLLESLCQWWESVTGTASKCNSCGNSHTEQNWRHPFGVRNMLDEGGSSDLDEYLMTGSTVGLVRTETMFSELQ